MFPDRWNGWNDGNDIKNGLIWYAGLVLLEK